MKNGLSRRWADVPETLERDPRSSKWMVRCAGCGRRGLNTHTPERFWNRDWLEVLGRLQADGRRLCEVCRRAVDKTHVSDMQS